MFDIIFHKIFVHNFRSYNQKYQLQLRYFQKQKFFFFFSQLYFDKCYNFVNDKIKDGYSGTNNPQVQNIEINILFRKESVCYP